MDEELMELRPAWRTYWAGLLTTAVLLLAAPAVWLFGERMPVLIAETGASVLAVAGLVVGVYTIAKRYSWKYSVTPDRLWRHEGLIARNQQSVRLQDLRSVELDQSLSQRLFRVGDLAFYSAGSAEAEVRFQGVHAPMAVRDRIYQLVDRDRPGDRGED